LSFFKSFALAQSLSIIGGVAGRSAAGEVTSTATEKGF
jgi:hypothetical protein